MIAWLDFVLGLLHRTAHLLEPAQGLANLLAMQVQGLCESFLVDPLNRPVLLVLTTQGIQQDDA